MPQDGLYRYFSVIRLVFALVGSVILAKWLMTAICQHKCLIGGGSGPSSASSSYDQREEVLASES